MGNCLFCGFLLICCNSCIQASYLNIKRSLSRKLDRVVPDFYCGRNLTLNCMASYLVKAASCNRVVYFMLGFRKKTRRDCQT